LRNPSPTGRRGTCSRPCAIVDDVEISIETGDGSRGGEVVLRADDDIKLAARDFERDGRAAGPMRR